jgi:hypothetical protein
LLIWMGVMASEGGDAVPAADVAAPPEAAADAATTEPMAAMDPNLAPPPAAPEAATGALQQAPSLGVVATIEDAVMWLVDENGNETGDKLVLPINENLEVLAVYEEYAITRRDDGTIGYVKNTAVQDVSAPAAE